MGKNKLLSKDDFAPMDTKLITECSEIAVEFVKYWRKNKAVALRKIREDLFSYGKNGEYRAVMTQLHGADAFYRTRKTLKNKKEAAFSADLHNMVCAFNAHLLEWIHSHETACLELCKDGVLSCDTWDKVPDGWRPKVVLPKEV